MKDEAIAPVVAFLLILTIVVSFFSIINAYYIPSLKQQSEVEHLQFVEEHFLELSPKIYQLLLVWQNASVKESIQLGGGDVVFSPIKSSGFLQIDYNDTSLSTISLDNFPESSHIFPINITYRPVGNYWINQGYNWTNGIVFVTKAGKSTSLQSIIDNENDLSNENKRYYDLLLPKISYNIYGNNLTFLIFDIINIEKPVQQSINGNGFGSIIIALNKTYEGNQNLTHEIESNSMKININNNIKTEYLLNERFNDVFREINFKTNKSFWNKNTNTLTNENYYSENVSLQLRIWNLSFNVQ